MNHRPRPVTVVALMVAVALAAAACSGGESASPTAVEGPATTTAPVTSTTIEDYPDAQTRLLRRLAAQPRPVERSALPPRHLDAEVFPEILVPRDRIVYGGAPPDGIPAIDEPVTLPVSDVNDLVDDEAVVVVSAGGEARVYPVRVLIRHEIVNDVVGGEPVVVTYCPLCNSAVAALRTVDGAVLAFGVSGTLYRSALVMFDRQTESLWTHFDGRAVVGDLIGAQLDLVSTSIASWAEARAAHPDALVVVGDDDRSLSYGTNPYRNTDQREAPPRAFVPDAIDERLPPMERTLGVQIGAEAVGIARSVLSEQRVVPVEIGGRELLALWAPGQRSAIQADTVAGGDEIGSVGVVDPVLDGRRLDLRPDGDAFVDGDGTRWSILGVGLSGGDRGRQLEVIPAIDTFWFAWSGYHPDTALVD